LAPLLLFAPCCCWLSEIFDIIFVAGIPAIAKVSVLAADPAVAVAPAIAVVLKYRTITIVLLISSAFELSIIGPLIWEVDYCSFEPGKNY
jgi:hypothetical protein